MKKEKGWHKWLPWVVTIIMAVWVVSGLRDRAPKSDFKINEFAELPVLLGGRIQPLDSMARNALLMLRGKGTVVLSDNYEEEHSLVEKMTHKYKKMKAAEWLLEAIANPDEADKRRIFRIDNQEVLGLLKLSDKRKYFGFNELTNGWEEVEKQAGRIRQAEIKPEVQTPFEKGIVKLNHDIGLYFRIKNSFRPESTEDFVQELKMFKEHVGPGLAALKKHEAGEDYDQADLQVMVQFFKRYENLNKVSYPMLIPPLKPNADRSNWTTIGASLMESIRGGEIHPAVNHYAALTTAYTKKDAPEFNKALVEYRNFLQGQMSIELKKGKSESFFNHYAPFVKSIAVYLIAFLFGTAFWFTWSHWTRRTAWMLVVLAFVVHTTGLIFRMVLEGRPPVTNLYSSAIFVGWGAVLLGIILEKFWRDGIGIVTAAAVGVATLIIAHNLSLGGDTMEMMRAVLDTNFWLATHVVVITLGYSSMFVAAFLAIVYIFRGVFTSTLDKETGKGLTRMVYGITCFATLFSFVGTILGGIWADQSWGRFWGWDPKENGALLIVIWCAIVLHARWGGMIRERGMMACALFGSVITAFSWFGVNMLGVGLHAYGFMDAAFKWLILFDASQVAFILLAMMPLKYWKSFNDRGEYRLAAPEPEAMGRLPQPRAGLICLGGAIVLLLMRLG